MTTARKLLFATLAVIVGTVAGLAVILATRAPAPDRRPATEIVAATTTTSPAPAPTPTPTPTPTKSKPVTPKPTPRPTRTTSSPKPKPKPTPTRTRTPARAEQRATVGTGGAVGTAAENGVVKLTNAARAKAGCKPLKHDPELRAAALAHSKDMAARGFFDHEAPDGDGPEDRIRDAGFAPIGSWGENIAAGQRTAAEVMAGWMDSPGHKANILTCAYTHIGVGFAGGHWTQAFASH